MKAMKAFYTSTSNCNFPHVMHVLEERWGKHALFTRDLSQRVFQYTLFDPTTHTLQQMCQTGNLEVVKYLVEECKTDIHANGENALHVAAQAGHLDVVKYLVEECKADIHVYHEYVLDVVDDGLGGFAPVIYEATAPESTVWGGHLDVIKYFVDNYTVDIHAHNDILLRTAAEWGHLEIVKYLVDHGADVHADNECVELGS